MKLVFKKAEDNTISVLHQQGSDEVAFDYVQMIKEIIRTRSLDVPEIDGAFSDAERESIAKMVDYLNEDIEEFFAEPEEDETEELDS